MDDCRSYHQDLCTTYTVGRNDYPSINAYAYSLVIINLLLPDSNNNNNHIKYICMRYTSHAQLTR